MYKVYDPDMLEEALKLTRVGYNSGGLLVQAHPIVAALTGSLFTAKYYAGNEPHTAQWTLQWDRPQDAVTAVNGWGQRLYDHDRMRQLTVRPASITGLPRNFEPFVFQHVRSAQYYPDRLVLVVKARPGMGYVCPEAAAIRKRLPLHPQVLTTKQYELQHAMRRRLAGANPRPAPTAQSAAPEPVVQHVLLQVATRHGPTEPWTVEQRTLFVAAQQQLGEAEATQLARAQGVLTGEERVLQVTCVPLPVVPLATGPVLAASNVA